MVFNIYEILTSRFIALLVCVFGLFFSCLSLAANETSRPVLASVQYQGLPAALSAAITFHPEVKAKLSAVDV